MDDKPLNLQEQIAASVGAAAQQVDAKSQEITQGEATYWKSASSAFRAHIKTIDSEFQALKAVHHAQDDKIQTLLHNLGIAKSTGTCMSIFGIFAGGLTAGLPLAERMFPAVGIGQALSLETAGYIGGFCTAVLIPASMLYVYWRHKDGKEKLS